MPATPRPWYLSQLGEYPNDVAVMGEDGYSLIEGSFVRETDEENTANMVLIVEAVNSYEQMRDALQKIADGSWNFGNRVPGLTVMEFARAALRDEGPKEA